jgi:hypothetical protein
MRRITKLLPMLLALVLALAMGGVSLAATNSATKNSTNKNPTTKTTQKHSAKSAQAEHMKKSMKKTPAKKSDVLASAENLSGTIAYVNPTSKELTLMGSNGVPYDFQWTGKTRVEMTNQKLAKNQLAKEDHKDASIRFVPTARGNVAENIQITTS